MCPITARVVGPPPIGLTRCLRSTQRPNLFSQLELHDRFESRPNLNWSSNPKWDRWSGKTLKPKNWAHYCCCAERRGYSRFRPYYQSCDTRTNHHIWRCRTWWCLPPAFPTNHETRSKITSVKLIDFITFIFSLTGLRCIRLCTYSASYTQS